MKKQFLTQRAQMAFVGVGMWCLLAFWSLSAFWAHIDHLAESYRNGAKAGAMAGEFALLALVLWHCFDRHIGVRRWALILGFVLAGVILIHAGALRGMGEAKTSQVETEKRMAETLTQMSAAQSKAVADASAENAGKLAQQGIRQRERIALAGKASAQQGEIARAAQEKVASTIVAGNDKVKDSSILPRWYLDGWCYSLIFIVSLAFVGSIFLLMMRDDVDANFDGIPDRLERDRKQELVAELQREREQWEFESRQPAPSTDRNYREMSRQEWEQWQRGEAPPIRPRITWRGGQRVDPDAPPRGNGSH